MGIGDYEKKTKTRNPLSTAVFLGNQAEHVKHVAAPSRGLTSNAGVKLNKSND